MAQKKAIEVEHNGETIDVPLAFERSELAAWFGSVPDSFEVDRVFIHEDNVRVESYQGEGDWVEAVFQTEESAPTFNASELGWVAESIDGAVDEDYPTEADQELYPGETVWVRAEWFSTTEA
jgi:hypothetical protein